MIEPLELLVDKTEAESQLSTRIEIGEEILKSPIRDHKHVEEAADAAATWHEFNLQLLLRLFKGDAARTLYVGYTLPALPMVDPTPEQWWKPTSVVMLNCL